MLEEVVWKIAYGQDEEKTEDDHSHEEHGYLVCKVAALFVVLEIKCIINSLHPMISISVITSHVNANIDKYQSKVKNTSSIDE